MTTNHQWGIYLTAISQEMLKVSTGQRPHHKCCITNANQYDLRDSLWNIFPPARIVQLKKTTHYQFYRALTTLLHAMFLYTLYTILLSNHNKHFLFQIIHNRSFRGISIRSNIRETTWQITNWKESQNGELMEADLLTPIFNLDQDMHVLGSLYWDNALYLTISHKQWKVCSKFEKTVYVKMALLWVSYM